MNRKLKYFLTRRKKQMALMAVTMLFAVGFFSFLPNVVMASPADEIINITNEATDYFVLTIRGICSAVIVAMIAWGFFALMWGGAKKVGDLKAQAGIIFISAFGISKADWLADVIKGWMGLS